MKETYGASRIHVELVEIGIPVGRKRVERLMKSASLKGVSRRCGTRTTIRDEQLRPASDLVDRNFYARELNVLWGGAINYVPTWAGFLYMEAVIFDAFSRRIFGWPIGHNLKAQLLKQDIIKGVATTG
ncbi:IS3 family transposase [Roseibium aggregatum]|uniref:IS3 family transposase n=1 Tax=Roseibium aggregatum TaxID=187304 RepID=A0A926NYC1_9HYPH|nr:IS3 family transposase [Roseibium aggregatum]MBD1549657.1 IS3 family transposase [Roseibium aggregatum]